MQANIELARNDHVTGFSFDVSEDAVAVMLDDVDAIGSLELPGYEFEDGKPVECLDRNAPDGSEVVAFYAEN